MGWRVGEAAKWRHADSVRHEVYPRKILSQIEERAEARWFWRMRRTAREINTFGYWYRLLHANLVPGDSKQTT